MEDRWNVSVRGQETNSEINQSQCHSVRHKPHTDWPRIEVRPAMWAACTICRRHGTASIIQHAFTEYQQFMLNESQFSCAENYINQSPTLYFKRHPYL